MSRKESPLEVSIKGAVAGLVGTAVITAAMKAAPAVMQQLGIAPEQEQQQGGDAEAQEEPTAKLAQKVAEGVFETPIDPDTRQAAAQAIHWGYGTLWGVIYGIVQSSIKLPHWLHGTLFGGIIALVASTLVPAMRITPPPSEQPVSQRAMMGAFQMLYGWTVAFVFAAISRDA